MSVRVNLLPQEIEERNRAARQRVFAGLGAAVLVAILILLYVVQLGRVNTARDELAAQQDRVTELQGQVNKLNEFGQLEQEQQASAALLASSLGNEASIAGILQDLAAVMPSDTELSSLNITVSDEQAPSAGQTRPSYGTMTLAGKTIHGHAPGLERFLLELQKVASFQNVYFNSSTVDDAGVSTFAVDVQLGPEIFTKRYANGLPEELQ